MVKRSITMDNYIVRIYRRDERSPKEIAGIVENVGKKEETPFQSFEELVQLMAKFSNTADLKFRVE